MNELTVFNSAEFGQVRTVTIDNNPWFVGKDVAEALGYERPAKAILDHVNNMIDIKELRKNAGLSQTALAEKCDRVRQTIGEIEAGRNKPSIELAKRFGEIFNVDWRLFYE